MYDVVEYAMMTGDAGRMSAYCRALERNIKPGSVVLDMGAGFGIMSFMACRAGAAKVYAVEPNDVIELAREVARDNGFADRIEFIQALTTEIDLPEKVDGIVSDLHGVLPQCGSSIGSILDARDRFLKPGGWMIPANDTMWAGLVTFPDLHDHFGDSWKSEYGFDFSRVKAKATNHLLTRRMGAENLLVTPKCWATLDYRSLQGVNVGGEVFWTIDRSAIAHGLNVWFDMETAPGIGLSNSPAAVETHVYKQRFFPWPQATQLVPGDRVQVRLRVDFVQSDYVWIWETQVCEGGCERIKAEYRQSTFFGIPISRERLRRRAHTFVAEPNEDAWIDRRILDLMDRTLTLGEIASSILAEFPSHFHDWNDALARIGNLSERYCVKLPLARAQAVVP